MSSSKSAVAVGWHLVGIPGDEDVIAEIAELLGVNPPCIKQNFSILSKQLNRQRGGDFEWDNKSRECVWEIVAEQARLYGYDIEERRLA